MQQPRILLIEKSEEARLLTMRAAQAHRLECVTVDTLVQALEVFHQYAGCLWLVLIGDYQQNSLSPREFATELSRYMSGNKTFAVPIVCGSFKISGIKRHVAQHTKPDLVATLGKWNKQHQGKPTRQDLETLFPAGK